MNELNALEELNALDEWIEWIGSSARRSKAKQVEREWGAPGPPMPGRPGGTEMAPRGTWHLARRTPGHPDHPGGLRSDPPTVVFLFGLLFRACFVSLCVDTRPEKNADAPVFLRGVHFALLFFPLFDALFQGGCCPGAPAHVQEKTS